MSFRAKHFRFPALLATLALVAACENQPVLEPAEAAAFAKSATPGNPDEEWLKVVRNVTARFHSTTQALDAGYAIDDHCVAVPGLGGMGHHWVKASLVDPVFDPETPEVLLYAPGPNGQPRLVAVEYIVINVGQERPYFGSQPFDIGGTPVPVDHWSLHVWVHESNPTGAFAPFNPNVSCQH